MLSKLSTSIKFINSLSLQAFATSVDFSNWTEHEGLKTWIQKQVDLMQFTYATAPPKKETN